MFRSYLKLICEYELHSLPNKKVSGAKDHDKSYIKVRPPLVRHLLRNRLFEFILFSFSTFMRQECLNSRFVFDMPLPVSRLVTTVADSILFKHCYRKSGPPMLHFSVC